MKEDKEEEKFEYSFMSKLDLKGHDDKPDKKPVKKKKKKKTNASATKD